MTPGLLSAIGALRRQTALRLVLDAAARWLALLVLLLMLAGVLDYLWRPADVVGRWLLLLVVLGGAAAGFRRWVQPVWQVRSDDVWFARWVERVDRRWGDELSSAVGFLTAPDDTRYGSAQLRRALIEKVEQSTFRLRAAYYLSWRPVVRSAVAFLAVFTLAMLLVAWAPLSASLAMHRVLMPWSSVRWPKRHQLDLLDLPGKVVYGQDVEIVAVDQHGRLPSVVTVLLQPQGSEQVRAFPMQYAGGKMVYRLQNVTRSFAVRVVGGDDDSMPWRTVEVVPAPQLESCQLRIIPPSYAGYVPYELSGVAPILEGSQVEWHVTVRPSADGVWLHLSEPQLLGVSAGEGRVVAEAVDQTGQNFRVHDAQHRATRSGRYWFEIYTRDGVRWQSNPFEFRVAADHPPSVRGEPVGLNGLATPQARLRLRGYAEDDYGVQRVVVRVTSENGRVDWTQTIWQATEPPRHEGVPPPTKLDTRRIDDLLDLSSVGELDIGDRLSIQILAEDFAGQQQAADPAGLRLVSQEELALQVIQIFSQFIPQLDEALKLQRETCSYGHRLEEVLTENETVTAENVDWWKTAEIQHRRAVRLLTDDAAGIGPRARRLREELLANDLSLAEVERALDRIATSVSRIQPLLTQLDADMSEVSRQLPEPPQYAPRSDAQPLPKLRATLQGHNLVLSELEALREVVGQWEGYRQFAGRLQELAEQQRELKEQSRLLQTQLLGRSLSQLTPNQRSQLRRLAQRQSELERRLEQWLRQVEAALKRSEGRDDQTARDLRRATEVAGQRGISGAMRAAADDLQHNRMGQATQAQQRAVDGLIEALAALAGRDVESRQMQLAELSLQLDRLWNDQVELDERRAETAAAPDANLVRQLADLQQQLAERTHEAARHAQDTLPDITDSLADAARHMHDAAEQTANRQWKSADDSAEKAKQRIRQAAEQLRNQVHDIQEQQLAQQQQQLERRLAHWLREQTDLAGETQVLDNWYRQQSVWSNEQRRSLESLATRQFGLAQQVTQTADEWIGMPVMRFQLQSLVKLLEEASVRLGRFDAGEATQALQQRALTKLDQLRQAFAASDQMRSSTSAENSPLSVPQSSNERDEASPARRISVQELRLLEVLQADLHERTERLEQQRRASGAPDDEAWQKAAQQLAEEQAELAQLLADLFADDKEGEEKSP